MSKSPDDLELANAHADVRGKDLIPASEPDPPITSKRRLWPVWLGLLGTVGTIGFFGVRSYLAPEPYRVLIAIDYEGYWWEGSKNAAQLADKLAEQFKEMGFEPVKADDPNVMKTLEKSKDLESAAKKLKAAYLVHARLAPEVIKHQVSGQYVEVRVQQHVSAKHVPSGESQEIFVRGFSGSKDLGRAHQYMVRAISNRVFDAGLTSLVRLKSVQEMLANARKHGAERIFPARDYVKHREWSVKNAEEAYNKVLDKRKDAEKGPVPVSYLGKLENRENLCGVGEAGVLVATSPLAPYFDASNRKVAWLEPLETLEWRDFTGKSKTVWKGYHLYGYSSSNLQSSAVGIEDVFGYAKAIMITDSTGVPRHVRIDSVHRFEQPKLSPSAAAVAAYDRSCARCAAELLVLDSKDGKELYRAKHEDGSFNGYVWLNDQQLAVLHTPTEPLPEPVPDEVATESVKKKTDGKDEKTAPVVRKPRPGKVFDADRQSLWLIDVSKKPVQVTLAFETKAGEHMQFPSASRDGQKIVVEYATLDSGGHLALLSAKDGIWSYGKIDGTEKAYYPSIAAKGDWIAYELHGVADMSEIAVIPSAGGKHTRLTVNQVRDRYPQIAPDGSRVFFETMDEDPNDKDGRSVSMIASVPLKP